MNKVIAIICVLVAGFGSISAATRYKGDINNDGKVDLADMVALAKAINEGTTDKNLHDLNTSDYVDDTDLQVLANLILTESLVEDTGFNIGIGGWEDGDEDFGGEVFSPRPAGGVRSRASEPSFFISDPLYDLDLSRQYVNIGISSPEQVCGALFEIEFHSRLSFDITKDLILNTAGGTLDGHTFYGKPIIINVEGDEWSGYSIYRLRFIVFSPELNPFPAADGAIVRLFFTRLSDAGYGKFQNCQTVSADATAATYHPTSDFYIDWTHIPVTKIEITNQQPLEIVPGQSEQLNISILPACASNQDVEYFSDNYEIASVDTNGLVTMSESGGTTTIHVRAMDGSGVETTCVVNGKISGIDKIIADTEEIDVYNAYGQLLKANTTSEYLNQLPPGFYIIVTPAKTLKYLK